MNNGDGEETPTTPNTPSRCSQTSSKKTIINTSPSKVNQSQETPTTSQLQDSNNPSECRPSSSSFGSPEINTTNSTITITLNVQTSQNASVKNITAQNENEPRFAPTANVIQTVYQTQTRTTFQEGSSGPTTSQNTPRGSGTKPFRYCQRNQNPDVEITITPPAMAPRVQLGPPPLSGAPPSYSAVMRLGSDQPIRIGPGRRPGIRIQPSPPFIAPIPPPSYAEAQGLQLERPMVVTSVDQLIFGPDPLSVVCPRCANVVLTATHSHRSNLTHFSALALCLCGCWPCCLLPYCMDSCKNTYHHCPSCQHYLGMYRPW